MEYAGTVARSVRVTIRNPFAVLLVSVAATTSLLPLLTGFLLAGPIGGLVGLWTTSFMLGFVAVGGARISFVVFEREVSLGTTYFFEGIRRGIRMGTAIGLGTFLVAFLAIGIAVIPASGILGLSLSLIGVYVLLAWFVLATYVLTQWASLENPNDIRSAFVEGGTLILERPIAAMWLLIQAIGWTLVSLPLIIAPVLVLPGLVQMVGTGIVLTSSAEQSEEASRTSSRT